MKVKKADISDRIGVLVLGMHRSGTSALARVLNLLGCDLPKTLMEARPSNETGHWESLPIYRLNDEILNSAGSNWHDWLPFNPGWHSSPKAAEYKEKALATLDAEFGSSRLFVLKDPRICRFAPFWLDVMETVGVRPAIIMPVRNPLEVAASISARDTIDPALGQLIWLRHVLEAEAQTRGRPRFHTSYDALLTSWPRVAAEAQEQLGVSWPRLSPLTGEEIDAFLTGRLRHHQEPPKSVADNPLLSAWLREAFAIFSRWADEGEAAADHATLDDIRAQLDAAAPAFARLISSGEQATRRAKSLDAGLKEAQGKLAEAESAAAAKQQLVETLERRLEESRSSLSAAQADAEQRQQQIAEIADRLVETQSQLSTLQSEAETLRAELDQTRGELSHAQSELAQRRAEADDAAAQLKQAEQRHAEELQAECDRHAEELEAQRNGANAEVTRLRQEKGAAEGRLTERFSELAALTRMLRGMESELAAKSRQLSERESELETKSRQAKEREEAARKSEEQAEWLREVSAVMMNGSDRGSGKRSLKGRMSALLPAPIRMLQQKAQLKASGIFDPDAYLAANPDVAEAGFDPLRHYINHGMREGRKIQ